MAKALTFWSVILGFILGVFASSTEEIPLSGFEYGDARFWRFVILAVITLASGIVFYGLERKQSEKTEDEIQKINKNLELLINEYRMERNERNRKTNNL